MIPEFMKHPEWYVWTKDSNHLLLIENAPDEAKIAYQEYLDELKYEDDNGLNY